MESVVIVAPGNYNEPIGLRLARGWQVSRGPQSAWVIQDATSRAYVTKNDLVRNELEPEDLRAIAKQGRKVRRSMAD
jgi:hypothetical protein